MLLGGLAVALHHALDVGGLLRLAVAYCKYKRWNILGDLKVTEDNLYVYMPLSGFIYQDTR